MIWLLIVVVAHILYALVFVVDKYVLSKPLPHPIVYAFYVGVLSFLILVLVPFGFYFPSFTELILVLIAGVAQVTGWVFYFKALNKGEVSKVVPFVGGFIAIFTLILSIFIINERLSVEQIIAFIFLVLGALILSVKKKSFLEKSFKSVVFQRKGVFKIALLSSLLFAIFWVITKYIFLDNNFITSLVWLRTAPGLVALTLLIPKKNRELIFKRTEKLKPKTVKFVISARALGVLGALGIYGGVYMGSVTLVNSLQGLQYFFVLVLATIFFKKFPGLKEQFSKEIIVQKIVAILLIAIGLFILVL